MRPRVWLTMAAFLGLLLGTTPSALAGVDPRANGLSADLDGKPIRLVDVADHHCHDLDYPVIHCFETVDARDESRDSAEAIRVSFAGPSAAAAAVTYVTIYEHSLFGGTSMAVAEDYAVLATIGWNDRISSFKVRNSETGRFYTDWFYGGTGYSFCCNQQASSLGGYNDTFSSVERT